MPAYLAPPTHLPACPPTAHFNFCLVPEKGYDAVLFVATALLVTCAASAKLSAVWVLIAGGWGGGWAGLGFEGFGRLKGVGWAAGALSPRQAVLGLIAVQGLGGEGLIAGAGSWG